MFTIKGGFVIFETVEPENYAFQQNPRWAPAYPAYLYTWSYVPRTGNTELHNYKKNYKII